MVNMKSFATKTLTGRQLQAARTLIGMSAQDLAVRSSVGIATIRRAEANAAVEVRMTLNNAEAVVRALDQAGVVFLAKNGGGPGVRLK